MKISEELRERAQTLMDGNASYTTPAYFNALADRIDAEMVELPRDVDGKPIHVGDTVYVDCNCFEFKVDRIEFHDNLVSIGLAAPGVHAQKEPSILTHERPDSLELIADEIEEADVDGCIDWADRIRRLEKEGGNDGEED